VSFCPHFVRASVAVLASHDVPKVTVGVISAVVGLVLHGSWLAQPERVTPVHARDHGFSLIEVLVSVLVLSVGMAGVLPLVFGSVRITRAARDTSMATWLAWQKAEELRLSEDLAVSPGDALATDTDGYVDHLDQFGQPSEAPAPYTRRWLIEAAGAVGAVRLVVAVHHAASPGTPVTVATVRRREGP